MRGRALIGIGRFMAPIPRMLWQRQVHSSGRRAKAGLGFMSEEHHMVRDFAVRELPRVGEPLSPESIAQELKLTVDRVNDILDELEKRMTFLFRDGQGAVTWAYPVTVERTPHHVTFSTGEEAYSA
jgi:hypothetical protein